MTVATTDEEIRALLDYAATADIGGDPLVVDLAASLAEALYRIEVLESDLRIARATI